MKKAVTIILLLAAAIQLFSCAGPYGGKESEVKDILLALIDKDIELSSYIWGDGFDTMEYDSSKEGSATPLYVRVSDDSPYHSCRELEAAAEEVYSTDLMKIIRGYAFENNDDVMSRFCDYTGSDGLGNEKAIVDLQVDITKNHPPYKLVTVADISTLKVKRSTAMIIECELECTVGSRESTMTVRLIKENGVWKIDSQNWLGGVKK